MPVTAYEPWSGAYRGNGVITKAYVCEYALGREAVKPLLNALTKADLPEGMYPAAHHVLHDLAHRVDLAAVLEPVLKAFDKSEPEVTVPLAATEALESGSL